MKNIILAAIMSVFAFSAAHANVELSCVGTNKHTIVKTKYTSVPSTEIRTSSFVVKVTDEGMHINTNFYPNGTLKVDGKGLNNKYVETFDTSYLASEVQSDFTGKKIVTYMFKTFSLNRYTGEFSSSYTVQYNFGSDISSTTKGSCKKATKLF